MQRAECDAATDGWMDGSLVGWLVAELLSLSYKLCARLVVCAMVRRWLKEASAPRSFIKVPI